MKKILILIPILFLVACNPKKDTPASVIRTNTGTTVGGLNTGLSCANGISNVGSIYDSSGASSAGNFEGRVKALLSATINPSEVGSISAAATDPTGLRFAGVIKLDSSGAVVPAQSNILIKVYDSYTLSGSEPIPLEFTPANKAQITGQFNVSTGEGFVSFGDQFGVVRFEGRIDAKSFSGVVKFQNSSNITGGSAASGTLGQFYVARCGIIQ